jgi:hypothetical protein
MGTTLLPADFKDFLRSLNSKEVEYLVIGGYAVGYHGYPRATADIDIWIAINPANAHKVSEAIREFFGYPVEEATPDLFLQENKVARMGVPPFRIEVLTTISGVSFDECYAERIAATGGSSASPPSSSLTFCRLSRRWLGYGHDPRLANTLALVRSKQDAQGRWPLEYDYTDKTWVNFGPKKQPANG